MELDVTRHIDKLDLFSALEPDLFFLESRGEEELKEISCKWFKTYLYSQFASNLNNIFGNTFDFLSFRSLVRDDYAYLEEQITNTVRDEFNVVAVNDYQKSAGTPNWRFLEILQRTTAAAVKIPATNNLIRYCATLRLAWYCYVSEILLTIEYKVLLCFADMQPQENMLAQLTKIVFPHRVTATLQHGLYADYQDFETVNVVNYKNHVCDYFLAWGEDTKRLIEKYKKNAQVMICGKPSVFGLPTSNRKHGLNCPDILVVTDQRIFQEYNEHLVDIAIQVAKKLNVNVFVRFHPSNNKQIIKSKYPIIQELKYIKKDYIILGVTTSMVYEGLVKGYRSFQMQSDLYCPQFPRDLIFNNASSLENLICSSIEKSVSECQSLGRTFIEATENESLEKYRLALRTLHSTANKNLI